jgi:hypothetical protein
MLRHWEGIVDPPLLISLDLSSFCLALSVLSVSLSHMSSQESLHRQYFGRLFNQTTSPVECGEYQGWNFYETKSFQLDGSNYVYEEDVMDVIGTHYTDYPMGRDFFHSMYRMHKDALADGAKKALDKIFGTAPSPTPVNDDDQEEEGKGGKGDDQDTSEKLLWLLALLFVPGVVVGGWVGMRIQRQRQQTITKGTVKKEIGISTTTATATNKLHTGGGGEADVERVGEKGAMRVLVS